MLRTALQSDPHRRCRPVMSVRDIDPVDACKRLPDRFDLRRIRDRPAPVPDPVFRHKIKVRIPRFYTPADFLNHCIFPVCKENRPSLCAARIDVAHTVFFLFWSGSFMPADLSVPIIIYGCTGHQAGLSPSVHGLLIQGIPALRLTHQYVILQPALQQFICLFIYL